MQTHGYRYQLGPDCLDQLLCIVGIAIAAALIGLQFVMIALIASLQHRSDHDAILEFVTPTIVQFSNAQPCPRSSLPRGLVPRVFDGNYVLRACRLELWCNQQPVGDH
jgi:hypothetical protein